MKPSYKLLKLGMMLSGLSLLMMGCATTQPKTQTIAPVNPKAACAVWPVVGYAYPGDTEPTVRGIVAANAARKAYCP
jgi:hypothetical protein